VTPKNNAKVRKFLKMVKEISGRKEGRKEELSPSDRVVLALGNCYEHSSVSGLYLKSTRIALKELIRNL
jgi:hypothetical protein